MDINGLISNIKQHLEPILDESGSIVFSSMNTIKKGDLYTLGLNPGGEADIPIRRILAELPYKKNNSYIDEAWANRKNPAYAIGQHPLQSNFASLIRAIGYDPSDIFSSNLIFTRSRGQYGSQYSTRADICWKAHEEFIKIIDPKYFIVFGNSSISPFRYIKDRYLLDVNDSIDSGHGKWKCYSCNGIIAEKERVLIGIPHLSRYYIGNHPDVIQWINSKF